jgi:hypothetical protein
MTNNPDETVIQGGWEFVEGRMVPDAALTRIQQFVQNRLQKITDTSGGWETLFRDPLDGRLWERFYPQSEMHGGGPESLRCIDKESAERKYNVTL